MKERYSESIIKIVWKLEILLDFNATQKIKGNIHESGWEDEGKNSPFQSVSLSDLTNSKRELQLYPCSNENKRS